MKLVGTKSPRSAVGARIRVIVDTRAGARTIHRAVGSVSSFGGSPCADEVGLGQATGVDRIEVDWPRSNETQVVSNVSLDTMIEIIEGQPGFRKREFRTAEFRKGKSEE